MIEPATAPYEVSRRTELFDLYERVWGARPELRDFEWWYEQAPAGEALRTLAVQGDRVVGVASMSLIRARVGGRDQVVPMTLAVSTDPDQRGRGIFSRLETANEEEAAERGYAVALTFPNAESRPIFLERLGWEELWRARVWARPPVPSLSRAQQLTSIPAGVERLDSDASGQIVDAAFLDWRYLRSPREYRVLGAFDGDRVRGLVAFRPRRGSVSVVCHALGEVGGLLRAAGSARPTLALVPPAQRRAFLLAGFVPTPKSVRVLGKQLRPEGSLAGGWQFQLGDFDVF
jgi:GNAT superfamily N-acetyltransferase